MTSDKLSNQPDTISCQLDKLRCLVDRHSSYADKHSKQHGTHISIATNIASNLTHLDITTTHLAPNPTGIESVQSLASQLKIPNYQYYVPSFSIACSKLTLLRISDTLSFDRLHPKPDRLNKVWGNTDFDNKLHLVFA